MVLQQQGLQVPGKLLMQKNSNQKVLNTNITFMPVPDDHTGPVYTYGDPKNIVIFKTCKNPQAALELY